MNQVISLSYDELYMRAKSLPLTGKNIYGIPNGGIKAALICHARHPSSLVVENPAQADVFVDDIIDSGATMTDWCSRYPQRPFYALVDKLDKDEHWQGKWVSMPWERENPVGGAGIEDNIRRIIQFIGDDPTREGLLETPARVARSYKELFSGYQQNVEDVFKCFTEGACNEMVLLRGIPFSSTCEHHMLECSGIAHVAYIPKGKILGLSKLSRLVDVFARRLQVQERLTEQITDALDKYLQPKGSACVIECQHSCMSCRGIQKPGIVAVTSSLTGVFMKEPSCRAEFFNLIKG
jgi:GTP cyclohydrolase I